MATVNVTITVRYVADTNITTISISPTNPEIHRGDTVNFTVVPAVDAAANINALTVYAWESSIWTDISNISPLFNTSFSRTVKADAPYASDTIGVEVYKASGTDGGVFILNITDVLDAVPDQFNLGPDLSGFQPNDVGTLSLVTVTGINTTVSASVTNGYFTKNGISVGSSTTVVSGNKIQVYGYAPSGYSSQQTVTLNIGGVTDSVILYTTNSPSSGTFIQGPFTSLPISLNAVKNFFGGVSLLNPAPNNIRSYFKGGTYVPNIAQNASIPTSGTIRLQNFLNSGTALYFTRSPASQSTSVSTVGSSRSLSLTWSLGSTPTNFDVGYGIGMRGAVNYRYTIVEDVGAGKISGASLSVFSGSPGTYHPDNNYVTVSANVGANTEARFSGTITIYVQSKYNTSVIITVTMKYFLNFFGP